MSKVTTSIGIKFERTLIDLFPELDETTREDNVPDFFHPRHEFWLEAKTGYVEWGVRIKDYQVKSFRKLQEPLVYAIGFHNFEHSTQRLTHKTERWRQNYLDRYMDITQICFVSKELLDLIWRKEKRKSKKSSLSYCMIKPSVINNVFLNRNFKRFGELFDPEDFYGFSYSDYELSTHEKHERVYRAILRKKHDQPFMDFMTEQGLRVK